MRIRTRIILTLGIATLAVLALTTISLTAGWQLAKLSDEQAWAQTASHEISSLLVLTHEYALHAEPRVAYQWHKRHTVLLQTLAEQHTVAATTIVQVRSVGELFSQLAAHDAGSADADAALKRQRAEILLGQLLTNTQALSDQFHELSLAASSSRDATQQVFNYTALLVPVISLLALMVTFALLAARVLRPLGHMRNAVRAVSQGDLSVRSDTGTLDEFGEFSRAFDSMALDLVTQLKQEITERRQIEEHLQEAVDERTASIKAIVDSAADGIITIDNAGIVQTINKSGERLFGYSAEEVIGHNVSMLMPEPYQSAHDGYLQRLPETGQSEITGQGREFEGLHKDGHQFPIYLSISEMRLANQIHYTGFVHDISGQKQNELALMNARNEADRANRAKSEFLSSMSHELRTPMNAILGFSQLMEYDDNLLARHKDSVKEILKAGHHLLQLINEVLDLSQIETGHLDLSLEPVEVISVVEECLKLVYTLAHKRDIRISHAGLEGAVVRADRMRLRQVLLNLLSNAIKYNREGGSVTLSVEPAGSDRLRIRVTDTGKGIPAEHMADLFQPFNRLGARNSEVEGTGIGLTITRRIVELMGGTVEAQSEVGVGSSFWLDLPLESLPVVDSGAGHDSPELAGAVPALPVDPTQHIVLYIEDNPSNIRLVAQILGRRPHIHLLTAHTPELGIALAHSRRPELILLDINMPGMNGYQVLAVIKAEPDLKDIPVIAVTAAAMQSDIERGKAAGFTDYLTKPIDIGRLYGMIDEHLTGRVSELAD